MNKTPYVKMIQGSNVKIIPLENYYDLQAMQNGFNDYKDMRDNGYSIITPELVTETGEPYDTDTDLQTFVQSTPPLLVR